MVYLKSSHTSPCSVASIFVILKGACLIFPVAGNVLEKCRFLTKNCLEWFWILLSTFWMTLSKLAFQVSFSWIERHTEGDGTMMLRTNLPAKPRFLFIMAVTWIGSIGSPWWSYAGIVLHNSMRSQGYVLGNTDTLHMLFNLLVSCLSRAQTLNRSILLLCVTIIYTTKIDTFVCPPHISETVAVRIMKLAHRSRIASTTKKIISKQILLSILSILF